MVAAPFLFSTRNKPMDNTIVHITVEGGVIQDVQVPAGMKVVVWDYDIDGIEPERLQRNGRGDKYVETIWE
jgi:hypothetical protein